MDEKQTLVKDDFMEAVQAEGIEVKDEEELPDGIGAVFSPRLSAPSASNKNWISTSKGGYNQCLVIDKRTGSCLPNCVGYAWGRWRELLGKAPSLSRSNAENWYETHDGYSRGTKPKPGAVICWRKGKVGVGSDGAGHVAIVEKVNSDGSITCSNSSYGGRRFWLFTKKAPYSIGTGYVFQGFIYLPKSYDEPTETKIRLQEANHPTSIWKGHTFSVHGTIKSDLTMTRVEVGIVSGKTGTYVYHYDNKKVNAKTFDIHKADEAMMFRKLPKGKYYYRIWAWDKNGAHRILNEPFTVK